MAMTAVRTTPGYEFRIGPNTFADGVGLYWDTTVRAANVHKPESQEYGRIDITVAVFLNPLMWDVSLAWRPLLSTLLLHIGFGPCRITLSCWLKSEDAEAEARS